MNTKAATAAKSIFEKKYITEAQARKAADKAGVAEIRKDGGVWVAVKPAPVQNVTPIKAKAPAKSKPVKNVTPAVAKDETKKAGRPISEAQVKVRRRVTSFIEAATDNFTVKQLAKSLKCNKMHISNAMRWAEKTGLVKVLGYKIEKRPGRKELMYRPAQLPKIPKRDLQKLVEVFDRAEMLGQVA